MEVKIKADSDSSENPIDVFLTNDNLDNYNFVDCVVEDKEYTISVENLFRAVKVFEEIRKEKKNEN